MTFLWSKIKHLGAFGLTLLLIASTPSLAAGGPNKRGVSDGAGGDYRAQRFSQLAAQIGVYLAKAKRSDLSAVNPEKFIEAVKATNVSSVPKQLYLNGDPKDAINYSREKRIEFYQLAWDAIESGSLRAQFVFHEFLGILEIPDDHYQMSSKLFDSPEVALAFNASDESMTSLSGTTIPFSIHCDAFDQQKGISSVGTIGNENIYGTALIGAYGTEAGLYLKETPDGPLSVTMYDEDPTKAQPYGISPPVVISTPVTPAWPKFLVQIAYGHSMDPSTNSNTIAQFEQHVTADLDVVLAAPKLSTFIHCYRVRSYHD